MSEWFEPAVRQHFGTPGLDWSVFQTEVDDDTDTGLDAEKDGPESGTSDPSSQPPDERQHDIADT